MAEAVEKSPTTIIEEIREAAFGTVRDVSIAINSYDDIFSDFDPRAYSLRQLSSDFLHEIHARYRETKEGRAQVRFIIPNSKRDPKVESIIKKRLKDFFAQEIRTRGNIVHKIRQMGIIYIIIGSVLLFMEVFLNMALNLPDALVQVLQIIFVPAGWFGMWNGVEKLVETPYEITHAIHIARKFENAEYLFISKSEATKEEVAASAL